MTNSNQISGDSGRAIVFVHGRGFTPPAEDLLPLLSRGVENGLEQDLPDDLPTWASTTRYLAYYGDLSNDFLRDSGDSYDEALDVNDLQNALNELLAIDRRKGFGVKHYDRLPGKSAARELAVSVFAPLIESIGLGKKVVAGRHKDLGEYWRLESKYRAEALERVRSVIASSLQSDDRVTLISHGTGSIIAYDALWQLSHDPAYRDDCKGLKLDLWVTLGAPLGDRMAQKQLLGAKGSGRERFPTNILAWHNVSAEDDYMSHDNTVADDYRAMLSQRQISSIRDYRIYNMAIRYGKSNPHNVLGYLVHPRVTKIIGDWLRLADGRSLPKSSS